jgi:hypothetical protein
VSTACLRLHYGIYMETPLIEITIFNYYIQSNPFIILDSRIIFDVTIGHHRIINGLDFVIS